MTAVSTTGFAGGAVEFALSQGIELGEVKALEPEAFENWLMMRSIVSSQSESVLRHATVLIDEGEDQDHFRALGEAHECNDSWQLTQIFEDRYSWHARRSLLGRRKCSHAL